MVQRRAFVEDHEHKLRRARAKQRRSVATAFDRNVLSVAQFGVSLSARRMGEMLKSAQAREETAEWARNEVRAGRSVDPAILKATMVDFDSSELVDIASAAEKFEKLGRQVLGPVEFDAFESMLDDEAQIEASTPSTVMARPDPKRMSDIIDALRNTGLLEHFVPELASGSDNDAGHDEDELGGEGDVIIDAELVEEDAEGRDITIHPPNMETYQYGDRPFPL